MNAKIIAVLFACCVLAILAGSTEAVKCYECSTVTGDPGCDDAFDASKMTTADMQDNCVACKKSKGKVFGITSLSRVCSEEAEFAGCRSQEISGFSTTVCYCQSDLCNSSDRVSTTTTLLALPALTYIVFRLNFL